MFKKVILLWLLSVVSIYAIEEQQIQKVMDSKIREVLHILKDKTLSQSRKEEKSIRVIDDVFAYPTMAKISLGKRWNSLTKNEKVRFQKAFEQKIKYSYLDKLRLYNNQKVIIKTLKKVKSNRITLETQVIGLDDTYKVVYLFYKKKQTNQWYIYDVDLAGVSIIQTYRKQFSEFLRTKSIKELLASL
ncbi:MlaC/ttg2D family ABC transporter substrate-binding protein [Sulfurovum mangrovi]|uniref:MlaC/ttg2D family ABC transporter substrate-binding protein n=1 Tax=Sulfurovum mangrovi TaxID=2893889 RepID=UPI001E578281|nr:ABC transporter substrate-binding protein [Sulfurovum mangrovi]UFH59075.1 ABC transporter substrate-binding protein [Sulfurovum mangrovi]